VSEKPTEAGLLADLVAQLSVDAELALQLNSPELIGRSVSDMVTPASPLAQQTAPPMTRAQSWTFWNYLLYGAREWVQARINVTSDPLVEVLDADLWPMLSVLCEDPALRTYAELSLNDIVNKMAAGNFPPAIAAFGADAVSAMMIMADSYDMGSLITSYMVECRELSVAARTRALPMSPDAVLKANVRDVLASPGALAELASSHQTLMNFVPHLKRLGEFQTMVSHVLALRPRLEKDRNGLILVISAFLDETEWIPPTENLVGLATYLAENHETDLAPDTMLAHLAVVAADASLHRAAALWSLVHFSSSSEASSFSYALHEACTSRDTRLLAEIVRAGLWAGPVSDPGQVEGILTGLTRGLLLSEQDPSLHEEVRRLAADALTRLGFPLAGEGLSSYRQLVQAIEKRPGLSARIHDDVVAAAFNAAVMGLPPELAVQRFPFSKEFEFEPSGTGLRATAGSVWSRAFNMALAEGRGPRTMLMLADFATELGDLRNATQLVLEAETAYPLSSLVSAAKIKLAVHASRLSELKAEWNVLRSRFREEGGKIGRVDRHYVMTSVMPWMADELRRIVPDTDDLDATGAQGADSGQP